MSRAVAMAPSARDTRLARYFLLIVFAYFAAHTVVRTVLGGSFEVDEAEMLVLGQDFRLGYGPQLPLYNWMQAAFFKIFGVSTFAIASLKNLLNFATYALLFCALRVAFPLRLAILGTVSLMLLPNVVWEAQRAGTHSTAMAVAIFGFLGAFLRLLRGGGGWRDHAMLGVWLGLGALSKYNFWFFALPLFLSALSFAPLRARLMSWRLVVSGVIAAAMIAAPAWWFIRNAHAALASTQKFYAQDIAGIANPRLEGLAEFGANLVGGMLFVILFALFLRFPRGAVPGAVPGMVTEADERLVSRMMLRAFWISAAALLAGLLAAGVSDVQGRWLLPAFFLCTPVLIIEAGRHAARWKHRVVYGFVIFLGLAALAAMADIRLRGAGNDSMRVDVLADELDKLLPGRPVVISGFYFTGNLKYHRPDWTVLPPQPAGTGALDSDTLVLIEPGDDQWIAGVLAGYGVTLPDLNAAMTRGQIIVPYRFEDVETATVRYAIIRLPDPQG
ncbi:ArnT family glycosyltransferase [Actibacterium sp. D379-3]